MTRLRRRLVLEALESRWTPAVTIVNSTTATFTDIDGDKATVKVSSGTLTAGLFTTAPTGLGDQLQAIDFSGGGFDGVSLTVSVQKVATGDGLANVGYINSTLHDLGAVSVKGDLGRIDAGDAVTATPGLKSLTVRSIGRYDIDTQAASGDLRSDINGALGALVVAGDATEVTVVVSGGADGKIGSMTIGGSLVGSIGNGGIIISGGDMGPVKVGRDLRGAGVTFTARISSGGKMASVTIGGSLIGGSGVGGGGSGQITSNGDMGPVKIGHDLVGGSSGESGRIQSFGKLASVTIGGSLIGGSGGTSGVIDSAGDMGPVKIGHDLLGGHITGSASLNGSGMIQSAGRIARVTIGGSVVAGIDGSTGTLARNATIRAGRDIGSLAVKGSLIGNVAFGGPSPVIISARGREFPTAGVDLAIGMITIGGSVEFANILAGYDTTLSPVNADAQVGAVSIGGDWVASSLAAGVTDGGDGFGNGNDTVIAGGSGATVSRIGSITIRGLVYGTPAASGADHFGFVAQQVGSFKSLGFAPLRTAGTDAPIELALTTGDVTIREVA